MDGLECCASCSLGLVAHLCLEAEGGGDRVRVRVVTAMASYEALQHAEGPDRAANDAKQYRKSLLCLHDVLSAVSMALWLVHASQSGVGSGPGVGPLARARPTSHDTFTRRAMTLGHV